MILPEQSEKKKTDINISESENIHIDTNYDELIASIKSYNPKADESLIQKAFLTAKKYHTDQFRKSGEPFIMHPIEVAKILSRIELDQASIIAALLHDLVEDTDF